jgi:hypothetical protein
MVRIVNEDGSAYHEPPYTWEEEQAFYRAIGKGPITVLHRRIETQPPPKLPTDRPEE